MDQDVFLWGTATAAYQVEGGLNGAGEPANNWAPWDRDGSVERCGPALGFWERPDDLLDRAAALGSTAFRMSIEWARVQPSANRHETIEPAWDPAALDRYADILHRVRAHGMEPVVTLFHFTHPLWCGRDFWLRSDAPLRFAAYVRRCVRELGRRSVEAGQPPVRWWITINEPAVPPLATYLLRTFPGTGWGVGRLIRAYDHALAAHIRGYDALHEVYAEEGWTQPLVSVNPYSMTAVIFDAVCIDILLARERGVARGDFPGYLRRAAARARRRLASVTARGAAAGVLDTVAERFSRLVLPVVGQATADALYGSSRPRKLDYLTLDHYDPVAGNHFGPAPSAAARRLRSRPGSAELWEQVLSPASLGVFLRQAHLQAPDRPILVAESGMCTPGSRPRPDGLTRDRFLRTACTEVLRARDEGIPVAGYLHWTLADNYEWGSYLPRYGLYGVDRRDGIRILDTDAIGVDAASVFAGIVAGDRPAR